MDKDMKELTREELEQAAAEYGVSFDGSVNDDELREQLTDAMEAAEPLTAEEIAGLDRERLKEIAEGIKLSYASNISTEKLKALIKANLFPEETPEGKEEPALKTKSIEIWANEKNTPSWLFAGLKQAQKWASGKFVAESEYDEGLEKLKSRPLGR